MDDPEEDLISISAEPKKVEVKLVVFFLKKCVIVGGGFRRFTCYYHTREFT
jgi:hypothetical protein